MDRRRDDLPGRRSGDLWWHHRRAGISGEGSVSASIVTDSPMLQGTMIMFTNPAFALSDGGKPEKIAGQKAIVKYSSSEKQGDTQIMVASRFLISIEGSGGAKSDLKNYAAAIDYKKGGSHVETKKDVSDAALCFLCSIGA